VVLTKAALGIQQLVNQFATGDRPARREGFTIAKAPSSFGAKRYKPANIRRSSIPNVGRFGDCRRNTLSG
jgi:hypothetical protein